MDIIALQVQNLTDARYFAAMLTPILGFKVEANQPHTIETIAAIVDWVEGTETMLEFDDIDPNLIVKHIVELSPKHVILPSELINKVDIDPGIKKGVHGDLSTYALVAEEVDFYILSIEANQTINADFIDKINGIEYVDLYLDFAAEFSKYKGQLSQFNCKGMVVRGGEEEKVGIKSYEEIDEIFEYFEED